MALALLEMTDGPCSGSNWVDRMSSICTAVVTSFVSLQTQPCVLIRPSSGRYGVCCHDAATCREHMGHCTQGEELLPSLPTSLKSLDFTWRSPIEVLASAMLQCICPIPAVCSHLHGRQRAFAMSPELLSAHRASASQACRCCTDSASGSIISSK